MDFSKYINFIVVAFVATTWVIFFGLNKMVFSWFEITDYIGWVFIPAGLRLFAVAEFGWLGVPGLFLGAMFTALFGSGDLPKHAFMLAAISSFSPLIGVKLFYKFSEVQSEWHRLDFPQVYSLVTFSAAANSIFHCVYFLFVGMVGEVLERLVPMFIGDLVGSLVFIYLILKPAYLKFYINELKIFGGL